MLSFEFFSFFLHVMLRNFQFIYTERDLLKAIIDGWVMAERVALSPLSGLICEIVNSVGQGNFTVVRKKAGKSPGISETSGCGNHSCILAFSYCEDLLRYGKTCAFGALTISEDCICQFYFYYDSCYSSQSNSI